MHRKTECLVLLVLLSVASGCFSGWSPRRELTQSKHISNFALDGKYLFFGAGYHLYRLNLLSPSIETVFSTDRILVEQPIIADGVAYFGGSSYVDQKGKYGEKQGFFAFDLQSRSVQWKFPLGVGGYGTYGTFPVLAGDRIIVCARQHLHCLERKTGKELWELNNWFGKTSDGVNTPYIYEDNVYFKISEQYFTNSPDLDGHWAKVSLDTGQRVAILPIADNPGKYHDMDGESIGRLVDGVVYSALRYDAEAYPASRFGALDLANQKKLWEIRGSSLRTKPAVSGKFVVTVVDNIILALERQTGRVAWSEPLGEIADTKIQWSDDRWKWEHENMWSRRFAVSNNVLIVQGSKGIAARRVDNGKSLWVVKLESNTVDTDPVVFQEIVIAGSLDDCSVFAIDLKSGKELWRIKVPDCIYYHFVD